MPSRYIVVDKMNHCLRQIKKGESEPGAWETSSYAGECTVDGDIDNKRQISRFDEPHDIEVQGNYLYLTDTNNRKIKRIDVGTELVDTVHQSDNYGLWSFVFGAEEGEFDVTAPHGVLYIQDQKETWLVGGYSASSSGQKTRFSGTRFLSPRDIQWADDNNLVVADSGAHVIKVIDLRLQQAQEVCVGK